MTHRYVNVADTAKEMRKALKAAFPGHKFSVRSSSYSGGASIDVSYINGPRRDAVNTVCQQFAGATFDGMQDLKSYHISDFNGENVHWGADFVFVKQEASPERKAATEAAIAHLDAIALNNLEAKVRMGRFDHYGYGNKRPMSPDHHDWRRFISTVAIESLYA